MSTLKYQANLMSSDSQYNRYLGAGGFRGVDVSDDPSKINETRFANATNMWKDYENQSGIAVETIPGYRKLKATGGKINGIFRFVYNAGENETKYVLVHCGANLRMYTWDNFMNEKTDSYIAVTKPSGVTITDNKSNAFQYRNRFFFLRDGYWEIIRAENEGVVSFSLQNVSGNGYIPKTFIDGKEYEQANAFSEEVINEYNDFESLKSGNPDNGYIAYTVPLYNYVKEVSLTGGEAELLEMTNWYYGNATWYKKIPIENKYFVIRIKGVGVSVAGTAYLLDGNIKSDDEVTKQAIGTALFKANAEQTSTIIFSMQLVTSGTASFAIELQEAAKISIKISTIDFDFNQSFLSSEDIIYDKLYCEGDESVGTEKEPGIYIKAEELDSIRHIRTSESIIPSFLLTYKIPVAGKDYLKTSPIPVGYSLTIQYKAIPTSFNSVGEYTPFSGSHDVSMADAINGCTLFDIFDDRIFLTGNPKLPNTIFYANRDNTGYVNPSYFGVLNWFDCGVSNEPIKAMVHNANNLIVMKGNTIQDSVISFYQPWQTQQDIIPKAYIRNDGLPGKGCVGLACNLRDDIVFLSETGLEGIDRQTVNTERAVGHRSSLVDAKLLAEDLSQAMYCEWKDYLVILFPSGNAYMADTRQISSVNGYHQYEWYLLNDIVTWTDDGHAYNYASAFPASIGKIKKCIKNEKVVYEYTTKYVDPDGNADFCVLCDYADKRLSTENNLYSNIVSFTFDKVKWNCIKASDLGIKNITTDNATQYIILEKQEELISGAFGENGTETILNTPSFLTEFNGLMLFGTDNGDICVFNTDKRGVRPERLKDYYTEQEYKAQFATTIDAEWYDRCGHSYLSGIETAFDNANVPHLTKNTIKKSCIVEVKLGFTSSFNSQFRTDRDGWSEPSQVAVKNDDFSDNDLFKADFTTNSNATIAVTEKTKKWVVKQYRMYSDKWRTPFGIYGIAYRYSIHGRIKN